MAIKNTYAVYIDGINRTGNAVMPLKWGDFLDERLDECYLSLRRVKKKSFSPLTPVEIRLKNSLYTGKYSPEKEETFSKAERLIRHYLVANDSATENPLGSGCYDHELYLIEVTKYAECVVVDAITFTNDLGKNYTENAKPVAPVETDEYVTWTDPIS